jgi:hypothetical protein
MREARKPSGVAWSATCSPSSVHTLKRLLRMSATTRRSPAIAADVGNWNSPGP